VVQPRIVESSKKVGSNGITIRTGSYNVYDYDVQEQCLYKVWVVVYQVDRKRCMVYGV